MLICFTWYKKVDFRSARAIRDRANKEVLDRYETTFAENPEKANDRRFRIEHAQHLHPEDIPRFAKLGAAEVAMTFLGGNVVFQKQ